MILDLCYLFVIIWVLGIIKSCLKRNPLDRYSEYRYTTVGKHWRHIAKRDLILSKKRRDSKK